MFYLSFASALQFWKSGLGSSFIQVTDQLSLLYSLARYTTFFVYCLLSLLLPWFTSPGLKPFSEQKLLLTYSNWNLCIPLLVFLVSLQSFPCLQRWSLFPSETLNQLKQHRTFSSISAHACTNLTSSLTLPKFYLKTRICGSNFLFVIFTPLNSITSLAIHTSFGKLNVAFQNIHAPWFLTSRRSTVFLLRPHNTPA